jgi:hypothetical protein
VRAWLPSPMPPEPDRFAPGTVQIRRGLIDGPVAEQKHRGVVVTLVVVLVVALVIALTIGEVVHQRRGPTSDESHGGFRLDVLAGASLTLAVIMCSFMLASSWSIWDTAARDSGTEAGAVSALFQSGSDLPSEPDAQRIGADTICYAHGIAEHEWPLLGAGNQPASPVVDHWRVQLEKDIRLAQTHSTPFISSVPIADAARSQTHYTRLVGSTRQPPIYLFVLLILVCVAAIFFITAFTVYRIPTRLRVPVVGVITFLLVATLTVIVNLSHPYDGVNKVGPGFMQQVADASSRDYQLLWGKAQDTCDSVGNPLS